LQGRAPAPRLLHGKARRALPAFTVPYCTTAGGV